VFTERMKEFKVIVFLQVKEYHFLLLGSESGW
jgi:hypothetical protein